MGVKSDYYFEEELSQNSRCPDLTQRLPSMTITLKPKPAYPFPSHATLVEVVKNRSCRGRRGERRRKAEPKQD
ncbi:MAG: hypothetical protein MZU95_12295 [Desulfomicrobium escambiense]|nr:hypothetical protein [Desulfomicrobium escambiense]